MSDENYSAPFARDFAYLAQAFFLERDIADRKHFIHEQNLGIEVCGNCKREPHVHATGVSLHGSIDELIDFSKSNDLIEFACDLGAAHAHDRAAQKDIL